MVTVEVRMYVPASTKSILPTLEYSAAWKAAVSSVEPLSTSTSSASTWGAAQNASATDCRVSVSERARLRVQTMRLTWGSDKEEGALVEQVVASLSKKRAAGHL